MGEGGSLQADLEAYDGDRRPTATTDALNHTTT
jgi:hypothetical protein